MHFSDIQDGSGSKLTKITVVAALHIAAGMALMFHMNDRFFGPQVKEPPPFTVLEPEPQPVPPDPEPLPMPDQKILPTLYVPVVEVDVQQQPDKPVVTGRDIRDPVPPQPKGPVVIDLPPLVAPPVATPGVMRTAVFADANACVKPDYPANAARNGETGVVTLALLVGTDGKVAGSKIQRSSGYRDLDKAAVNALSMCKFKPAMANGVPEQAWAQLSYVWTLEG